MLAAFTLLLVYQLIGEAVVHFAALPVPGPVVGMLLLMAMLGWPRMREAIGAAAEALLAHLSLLFVPVGVGVMVHMSLVAEYGLRMMVALILSTWIGLAVTALLLRALLPRHPQASPVPEHE